MNKYGSVIAQWDMYVLLNKYDVWVYGDHLRFVWMCVDREGYKWVITETTTHVVTSTDTTVLIAMNTVQYFDYIMIQSDNTVVYIIK